MLCLKRLNCDQLSLKECMWVHFLDGADVDTWIMFVCAVGFVAVGVLSF